MIWPKNLKSKIITNEPLKRHTTFKIGGPAEFFAQPSSVTELKLFLSLAKRSKLPVLVIGCGSNILAADNGIKGVILHLNARPFKRVSIKGNCLSAGSAVELGQLIRRSAKSGFSGLEFLSGIPGTLGGALAMNAGCWGKNISDLVEKVTVMDYNGNLKNLSRAGIKYGYRKSNLAKFIILSASMKVSKKDKLDNAGRVREYLKLRRDTQDASFASAGCVFKNPEGRSAGRLIDLCGLKGRAVGGASVSLRHANFILNSNNACSRDVLKLMELIKKSVKHKFNITLQPEIKIWQ